MATNTAAPKALVRSNQYVAAAADGTQVGVVSLAGRPAIAVMFAQQQVMPLPEGGYGVVPVAICTITMTPEQAQALGQTLLGFIAPPEAPPVAAPATKAVKRAAAARSTRKAA